MMNAVNDILEIFIVYAGAFLIKKYVFLEKIGRASCRERVLAGG